MSDAATPVNPSEQELHRLAERLVRVIEGEVRFDPGSRALYATDGSLHRQIPQLLPSVRNTPADTLIITNGFSCKEQITQATGRRAWNMAEVLELALQEGEPTLALIATSADDQRTEPNHERELSNDI